MSKYNNYDNFEKVLKKIKKDSNRVNFQFSLDRFANTSSDISSIDSLFSDVIGTYFSYAYENKEEIENIIATIIYELIDYFIFAMEGSDDFRVDIFDGIKDKYFLIEFNDIQMKQDRFDEFQDLLEVISFKSVRDEYISILEDNKKEIYLEKKFCILFLIADYKAKFLAEIDKGSNKVNTFKLLIKL